MFFSHTLCQVIIFIFVACFFLSATKQSPDFCIYELTPGQMARMIAQVKQEKDYIYCNYANILDTTKCASIPCTSTATSPNCALKPTSRPTSRIPTSARPTSTPSTSKPTQRLTLRPTTRMPSTRPSSAKPTTRRPTLRPTTRMPSSRPTSAKPTTQRPTLRPTTRMPSTRPTTAPDHSSANKADDRALYTNMWSSSNGRKMELYLP